MTRQPWTCWPTCWGDLPLALEEAAAYLEETHTHVGEYLDLVRERARELFGLDPPTHRRRAGWSRLPWSAAGELPE